MHVSWSGTISTEDLESFGATMPRVGRELGFAPDVIHTFDDTTGFSFQPVAAYHHSQQSRHLQIPNPVRAAIVTDTQEGEALATVFKTLNRTPNLEMKVFSNQTAARLWLARK